MVRGFVALVTALLVSVLAASAAAQSLKAESGEGLTAKAPAFIQVTNSAKDIEILLARLLKQQFKLESSLKVVNDDPDNLSLHIPIGAEEKQGIPRVLCLIDTAVVARDKDGNAISQTISIAATADQKFTEEQMPNLLRWANAWNARMLPIRIFIVNTRVYTGMTVLATGSEPASTDRVVGSFLGVVRAWSAVMQDLRANKLVVETQK